MRVYLKGDVFAGQFSELLLKIGNGRHPESEEKVTIFTGLGSVVTTLADLTARIYPDIADIKDKSMDWLCERAILISKNDKTAIFNIKFS